MTFEAETDGLYWLEGEGAIAHAYEVNARRTRVRLRWVDERGLHRRRARPGELTPIDPALPERCPTIASALRDPSVRGTITLAELAAAATLLGPASRAARRLPDARAAMASGHATLIHVVGNCIVVAQGGPEAPRGPGEVH